MVAIHSLMPALGTKASDFTLRRCCKKKWISCVAINSNNIREYSEDSPEKNQGASYGLTLCNGFNVFMSKLSYSRFF